MKRILIMLIVIALVLPLCACSQEKEEFVNPVSLYYPRKEPGHGQSDSLISAEIREGNGHIGDLEYLLDLYFAGPANIENRNPFPAGTYLVATNASGDRIIVTLSDHFAALSGMDLTVSCACIYQTVSGLTGCSIVQIRAENAPLDGKQSITMDSNTLLLQDTFTDSTKSGGNE